MTTQKYSLKRHLLVEEKQTSASSLMLSSLIQSVDTHQSHGSSAHSLTLNHPGCHTVLDIEVDGPDALWVNNLDVVGANGKPDSACFRKGYGRQMLSLLTQAADEHGVTLELIAAPPAYLKRQMPDLPDKDQLAALYGDYGFYETSRNFAQVHMRRDPSQA